MAYLSVFPLDETSVIPWRENDWTRNLLDTRDLLSLRNALATTGAKGESEVQNTDKEFRIRLNLCHFSPEEVKITSDNNRVTITAKHQEKEDKQDKYSYVSREVIRSYKLPKGVDPKSVTSTMNAQGVLNIRAEKKEAFTETAIPVEFKK